MLTRPRLPTPIVLVVLTGCILYFDAREDDRPPLPAGDSARLLFERDVYPILAANCMSCHATTSPSAFGFVDVDPAQAYTTLVESGAAGDFSPTGAPIVQAVDAGHAAVTYTADERAQIVDWLTQDLAERQAAPPPAPFADHEVREWSGCMSYADFLASNMPALTDDFRALTERRAVLLTFFAVDISHGVATPQIVVNTHRGPPGAELQRFYELTRTRQANRACGPPRLKD